VALSFCCGCCDALVAMCSDIVRLRQCFRTGAIVSVQFVCNLL
jgi:hypothetical protein